MSRSKGVYLETELFDSKAYKSLTKAEMRIYFEFLLKRQFGKHTKKHPNHSITNNGKIVFTYKEAERKGFTSPTFRTAIDHFIGVGLIDLIRQGYGGIRRKDEITGESNLFAISSRWRQYGTPNFENRKRTKDKREGRGWTAYHARKSLLHGKD